MRASDSKAILVHFSRKAGDHIAEHLHRQSPRIGVVSGAMVTIDEDKTIW